MPFLGGGTGGKGKLATREVATIVTSSLAPGASQDVGVYLGDAWRLYSITLNQPGRFRIYSSAAGRTADANRPVATQAVAGDGVLFDFNASPSTLTRHCTPMVDGFQEPGSNIIARVDNTSDTARSITVTLTYLRTE